MPRTMLNDLHKSSHLVKALYISEKPIIATNHSRIQLHSFLLVYRRIRLKCSRLSSAAQLLRRLWPALPRVHPESSQLHVLDPFAAT